MWRSIRRAMRIVVRIVRMVVMVVMVIIWISPTPIVRITPIPTPSIAIRIVPIIERIVPAVIPAIRRYHGGTPRTEHRGYILRLDPHHIARNDNIIEGRIVSRSVEKCIGIAQRIVRRGHTIGWRRESIQAASICALVAICQHRVVDIDVILGHGISLLCRLGLYLGQLRLILSLLSLVLSLRKLRLCLLTLGNSNLVVNRVQVVRICYTLPSRTAARQE